MIELLTEFHVILLYTKVTLNWITSTWYLLTFPVSIPCIFPYKRINICSVFRPRSSATPSVKRLQDLGGGGLSIEVKLEKPVLEWVKLEPLVWPKKDWLAALSALGSHVALSRQKNKTRRRCCILKTNIFKHIEDKKYTSSHPGAHLPLKVEVCVLFEVSSVLINSRWFEQGWEGRPSLLLTCHPPSPSCSSMRECRGRGVAEFNSLVCLNHWSFNNGSL